MINVPKGTKDVLPQDSYKWQFIEKTAREVAKIFNIKEIRTPTFEHTEVFLRGVGETTDIVQKEMYTFQDQNILIRVFGMQHAERPQCHLPITPILSEWVYRV